MEFIKKNKNLLILLILASVCLFFSIGKIANIFIDVGREIYYPLEILRGKVLYKDLFCIYGPFSYLFNALVYKIFGAKLTSLYLFGGISALLITGFIYLISRKFLSEFVSFIITVFVIITGCLATRIFNFTLPYSYAVLYGLVCFLVSVFFLINFVQNKKPSNLFYASVFGGFAIANKYDFILYIIPLFAVILKTKNLKLILKALSCFIISLIFPFVILFIQGLKIENLVNSFQVIKDFASTESLRVFYLTQGVYYTPRIWGDWLFSVLKLGFFLLFLYLGLFLFENNKVYKKIIGAFLIFAAVYCVNLFVGVGSYLFLTFLTLILFIFGFKKNTADANIFILSSIFVSLKSLWGISHANYGLYYIGIILISFFILISNNFNKRFVYSVCFLLIGMGINYFITDVIWISHMNEKIITDKGRLETLEGWGKATNGLLEFMNTLNKENPNIIIFPEGLSINFLSKKETTADGFYNSLIPLYVESFGEDKIINNFKENMPDYIVFSNYPSDSYEKGAICNTYAEKFCGFVFENYFPVKRITGAEDEVYLVFEKK